MDNNDIAKKTEIIKAFIKNEEVLSDLYAKYAEHFPDDVEFWIDISKDETVHASWVYDLHDKFVAGSVSFQPDRFHLEPLNAMASYITSQIERLQTEKITPIQALSISMDIENSMLERNLFETYDSDDIEISKLLNRLRVSTEIHYAEVKKRYEDEKASIAS